MNGMQRKTADKRHAAQWTDDGLPRDPRDWTEEDWRDLWEHVDAVARAVAKRHAERRRKGER